MLIKCNVQKLQQQLLLQQQQSAIDAKERSLLLLEHELKDKEARLESALIGNTRTIEKLTNKNAEIQLARRSDEKERLDLLAMNEMLKMTAETLIIKRIYAILHGSKPKVFDDVTWDCCIYINILQCI